MFRKGCERVFEMVLWKEFGMIYWYRAASGDWLN